jgi:putative (di)nucleoside polyphosphate hydrolase
LTALMTQTDSSLPYRPCVGMMLFDSKGRVFVGKRIDQTLEAWQMPQGGIDEGENARAAVLRELKEEIGTDNVAILREHPGWLMYDLPAHLIGVALQGLYRGQKQKWFALRFLGDDSEIDIKRPDPEFSEWKWVEPNKLINLIVPFKREIYKKVLAAFADLANSA